MTPNRPGSGRIFCLALTLAATALAPAAAQTGAATASAQTSNASASKALAAITAAEIEAASYDGGDLPPGQSALTAKVQILLDRSGISPGVVDGWRGGMSESAIKAFQRRAGLPMTGRMDHVIWDLLHGFAALPLTMEYTITEADAAGLVDRIPADYGEKAGMSSQGFTSVLESLAERFHMDEKFLAKLNAGKQFLPGTTIAVTTPAKPIRASVTRIIIDKDTRRVAAYDAKGRLVADYPATVGSSDTPSPHGNHVVDAVAVNPTYTYNPQRNFKQGENDSVLIIPPGPNGPVGNVWIDLSEPTYGIHGTATPSRLFVNQSHGCVRLTNWDALELAHMVKPRVTTVEFLPAGTSIADVTGTDPAATATTAAPVRIAATRPRPRAERLPAPESSDMAQPAQPVPEVAQQVPAAAPDPLAATLSSAMAGAGVTVVPAAAPAAALAAGTQAMPSALAQGPAQAAPMSQARPAQPPRRLLP
ncbi:L,D-transpeptidase [Paracoccus sp. (in: a-proteobacteria)]|uniref:L,D-transpeptidase family protein n=1 Tax=Paracoccus sp. TaxID=267 RepID=UPI0032206FA8